MYSGRMESFKKWEGYGLMNRNSMDLFRCASQWAIAGLVCLATILSGPAVSGDEPHNNITRLSEHLLVYHGPINVGIIQDGDKALLVDCGDGSVAEAFPAIGVTSVDRVLFTHHHRDQACGAYKLVARGARVVVPSAERDYFAHVERYWNDPKNRWHIYYMHPQHLMLSEPVQVDATLSDGNELNWGPASIQVLATPGHTDGSVSYLVEVDGQKIVFSGDLIYDEGQVWDIYSLQKGFKRGVRQIRDYHGFMGARDVLAESLKRVKDTGTSILVPSHGQIMSDPPKAIDTLCQRLDTCYEKYVAISALRHYFPELFSEYAGRAGQMPIRKGKPVPSCLRHFETTWMIVSQDKVAFVMDCGYSSVVKNIQKLIRQGKISSVEGLWITHYHDDHIDMVPEFRMAFDCPCITDQAVARVISEPLAWRLPCMSPNPIKVDRATRDGESWQWHEFKMTAYYLPGQTLYHSGLLVEGQDVRMLFVGDSFTAAGIDDYCTSNRNWLGQGVGFDRCIALVEKLKPTHIFNCHVDDAFDFTPQESHFMRDNLSQREKLFGQIVPWDHPNYGLDESWIRCDPYEQHVKAGEKVSLRVVVTNHSSERHNAYCRAVLPRAWNLPADQIASQWNSADLAAKTEGSILLSFNIPPETPPGRYVIPVDLQYAKKALPQFKEAIVVVQEPGLR